MKKRKQQLIALGMAMLMVCGLLTGCGKTAETSGDNSVSGGNATAVSGSDAAADAIRIGSLKGPTSMGLLFLMEDAEAGETENAYEFQMAAAADELLPLMIKGELDIALLPANVASVLYSKTEGGVSIIDINTLGVLYMVSGDASLENITDLEGRTIYLTGKGTTPDYALQHILTQNGLSTSDCKLEYKSEATEVAAMLAENPDAIGVLPQPFAASACMQNNELSVVFDMNEEWDIVQGDIGNGMVTGVTVVRNEFLAENEEAVRAFMKEHAESTNAINQDVAAGAALAVEAGIIAKEPIAQKAIPECNIVCVTGTEMKQKLSGYLKVLYEMDSESVGGSLPGDAFYYTSASVSGSN